MENGQLFPEHGAESILFATVLNSGHLSGIIFCMFMSYFVKRNKLKKNPNIYQIWLPIIYFHCILFKLFSSYVYVYTGIYHIVNIILDLIKINLYSYNGFSSWLSLTRFHPYWIRAYPARPRVLISQTVISIWVSTGFSGISDPIIIRTRCVNDV